MRLTASLACALLVMAVQSAPAATYAVGPGKPYLTPGDVPWEALAPGDSVLIHARAAPYADKWVICRVGTEAQPIVVHGVPDPSTGALPVIDGRMLRPAARSTSGARSAA